MWSSSAAWSLNQGSATITADATTNATADATADVTANATANATDNSTAAKKTSIFNSFSRIT